MSLSEQLSLQQLQGAKPKKPSPSKRKRADSPPPSQAAKVKKEPSTVKRVKKEPVPKAAPRMKQEHTRSSPASTPSRSRVKQESGPSQPPQSLHNSSPHIKTDPYAQPERVRTVLLSGTYEVNCATASDIFGDYNLELTLAANPARNTWWATFRWGAWDVIIQMSPGPDVGSQCTLGWRLRDLETGQLTFGKRCTGAMTFFDDQSFTGALFGVPGVGTVEFDGSRLPGESLEDDLRHEWDAVAAEAYGR